MDDEYQALLQNQTWKLVPKLRQQSIGCKWNFHIKQKANGSIVFKERNILRLIMIRMISSLPIASNVITGT